jgi:hopanoid biosynthesis associated RND transporter like protein HpnN
MTHWRGRQVSPKAAPRRYLTARLVGLAVARARMVVGAAIVLCALTTNYVVEHFAMTTDTYGLFSARLPWRVRQTAFDTAFPTSSSDLVVVIDGQTPELSDAAAAKLSADLGARPNLFRAVRRPDAGAFWMHNALLFAPLDAVRATTAQLVKAQPFLGTMAFDPSLRGLADTLSLLSRGVHSGQASPQSVRTFVRTLADALHELTEGRTAFLSWRFLLTGQAPGTRELRNIILADPVLDYTRLQPGKSAVDAIRATAQRLQLDPAHGVRVRLTGSVPLADDEFATLAQRAALIAFLAAGAIVMMLWFALRSFSLIAAVLLTTFTGLVTATGIGLALFHRFNLISVAFIPLFLGMGMDLGIQFSVRYRAQRQSGQDVGPALASTGTAMGKSLSLAVTAIGAGFLSFAPTPYRGVSQLGVIAGLGMFAALALNLTLLPALIALMRPPGTPNRPQSAWLVGLDSRILRHRRAVIGTGAIAALGSLALLPWLHFDFNPMHLRGHKVESVATLLELMKDRDRSPNSLELIRPDLSTADRLAAAFGNDPTVASARTLSSFIPAQQDDKIALIKETDNLLDLTLTPPATASPPTDIETIDSLRRASTTLRQASNQDPSLRLDANRLANELDELATGSRATRHRVGRALLPGFSTFLDQLRLLLQPRRVTVETLPPNIVRQWQTSDGRARISVLPKGDSNDDAVLERFVAAGEKIAPDVTGTAIYIQAYARAVVNTFIEAGLLSFVAICGMLLIALRRIRDVAITMAPIVLTGLLTMGTCVLIGQSINFANIIALPLLFGIGVAFHIYFVMSWRSGGSHLLTSSLARGVFFSALATGTAFGSLWASKHPGTASMGKLLMVSLVWTLASALLFQPALMGSARTSATS